MGIYVEVSEDPLWGGQERQWAFPLTDDERSLAYIAWRDSHGDH